MKREWLDELIKKPTKSKPNGHTQYEIAKLIGVRQQTISKYILGIVTPEPKKAIILGKILKFNPMKFYKE